MSSPKIENSQTNWYIDNSGNPVDDSMHTIQRQGMGFTKARREITVAGVFNRSVQDIQKSFRNMMVRLHIAKPVQKAKPAEAAAPAVSKIPAIFLADIKEKFLPYQRSERDGEVYQDWRNQAIDTRKALRSAHPDEFPQEVIEQYQDAYDQTFFSCYEPLRKRGMPVTAALLEATKFAREDVHVLFLSYGEPEYTNYAKLMQEKPRIGPKPGSQASSLGQTAEAAPTSLETLKVAETAPALSELLETDKPTPAPRLSILRKQPAPMPAPRKILNVPT